MADGGACDRCGYARRLRPGDVWRCVACGLGLDGSESDAREAVGRLCVEVAALRAERDRLRDDRLELDDLEIAIHALADEQQIEKFCSRTGYEWSAGLRLRLLAERLQARATGAASGTPEDRP